MAQVSVTIDGKKYRLACNEGEEGRLEQLAGMVDEKINELRQAFGEIGDQRLVVMAALTFADQFTEARDRSEVARERVRSDASRSEAVAATLDGLGANSRIWPRASPAARTPEAARIERHHPRFGSLENSVKAAAKSGCHRDSGGRFSTMSPAPHRMRLASISRVTSLSGQRI